MLDNEWKTLENELILLNWGPTKFSSSTFRISSGSAYWPPRDGEGLLCLLFDILACDSTAGVSLEHAFFERTSGLIRNTPRIQVDTRFNFISSNRLYGEESASETDIK